MTLRVRPDVFNLRSRRAFDAISLAIGGMRCWHEFRVVHFSTQGDHLHLIVEADHNCALSEGMQGLTVRLAKALNRMMARRGPALADRYHAHVLSTPAEVRNALAYVLLNHRSHMLRIGERVEAGELERFSSAASFDGWAGGGEPKAPTVTSRARSWLLRTGWRRRGLLSPDEAPGTGRVRAPPAATSTLASTRTRAPSTKAPAPERVAKPPRFL